MPLPDDPPNTTGETTSVRLCPQCEAVMPADAPKGLCPRCLLQLGFESQDGAGQTTNPYQAPFVAPLPEHLAPHFPQLEILQRIGFGGMGVVYHAKQTNLDRDVALKILRPDVDSDPQFAERFAREARLLAKLSHPNIIGIYDFGKAGPVFYLMMEYVAGSSLRQIENAEELKPAEALAIIPQVCEALQYAHSQGVVHRDIKPENILVDTSGRVKIADFGLARMFGVHVESSLTRGDAVMGTPH